MIGKSYKSNGKKNRRFLIMNYNFMKRVMVFTCLAITINSKSSADLRDNFRDKKLINSDIDEYFYKELDKDYYDLSLEKETYNQNGESSNKNCTLSPKEIIDLHDNYLPSSYPVVVDLGSGFGACAKQLAMLGYKVYSVDKDKRHIQYQETNFCNKNIEEMGGFLSSILLRKPSLITQYFKECEGIKKDQEFVVDDITDIKSEKIPNKEWDIVLLTNVMIFLNNDENVSKMLSKVRRSMSKKGIFYVYYRYKNNENGLKVHTGIQRLIDLRFRSMNYRQNNKCKEDGGCTFFGFFRARPHFKAT